MFIDLDLQIALAQSVVAATGTSLIGSQIDTAVAGTLDGTNLGLIITVSTGIQVAAGTGTLRFQLATDTSAAISTSGSADVLYQTPDFATSTTPIPAGTVLFACGLPRSAGILNGNRRFVGLLEVVGSTAVSAGAINAFLTLDLGRWQATQIAAN